MQGVHCGAPFSPPKPPPSLAWTAKLRRSDLCDKEADIIVTSGRSAANRACWWDGPLPLTGSCPAGHTVHSITDRVRSVMQPRTPGHKVQQNMPYIDQDLQAQVIGSDELHLDARA
jgi:hypothetical protein